MKEEAALRATIAELNTALDQQNFLAVSLQNQLDAARNGNDDLRRNYEAILAKQQTTCLQIVQLIGFVAVGRIENNQLITLFRHLAGKCGEDLVEAAVAADIQLTSGSSSIEPLTREVLQYLRDDKKIYAIKVYRDRMRCGLKEAKEAVEKIARDNNIPRYLCWQPGPDNTSL
jgi:ribosomal protein L7/L12